MEKIIARFTYNGNVLNPEEIGGMSEKEFATFKRDLILLETYVLGMSQRRKQIQHKQGMPGNN